MILNEKRLSEIFKNKLKDIIEGKRKTRVMTKFKTIRGLLPEIMSYNNFNTLHCKIRENK